VVQIAPKERALRPEGSLERLDVIVVKRLQIHR